MKLPESWTAVTLLSKILAIILFVSLPFIGFYFGVKYKKSLLQETIVVEPLVEPDLISPIQKKESNSGIDWNANLAYSKDYDSYQIGLFNTNDLLEGTLLVAPIENGLPIVYRGSFIISSFIDYGDGVPPNFFDIINDKIYILDQETSNINIYVSGYTAKTTYFPSSFQMIYQGQIERSKYGVGSVYGISCKNNSCHLSTIKNPSSGCEMDLNITTKQYSNIKCTDMLGEFKPELINN